jgi:hypothetical protein
MVKRFIIHLFNGDKQMNQDHMVARDGKINTYVGRDAVAVVKALTLWSALKLYHNSGGRIIPTRGVGITKMLALVTQYTGKKYKRTEVITAAEDVKKWADEMKAALPVVEG